jgi:hypothetical protein
MATDIWRPVRGELRRILLTVPGVPDIAYEGRDFTPTSNVAWLRERIDKGAAVTATLGTYGQVEERAIYALDLNWPRVGSFAEGEDIADAIRIAFWPGREITGAGTDYASGGVLASHARTAIVFDGWVQFPVRVEFFFRRKTAQGRA